MLMKLWNMFLWNMMQYRLTQKSKSTGRDDTHLESQYLVVWGRWISVSQRPTCYIVSSRPTKVGENLSENIDNNNFNFQYLQQCGAHCVPS